MPKTPAAKKGYCNYCSLHVSVGQSNLLWQHKPRKGGQTGLWDICPGPLQLHSGWSETPISGISQYKRDVANGVWPKGTDGKHHYMPEKAVSVPADYVVNLRKQAEALLPDTDKESWDKTEVITLLMAFLSHEPEAADAAARAVGVQELKLQHVKDEEGEWVWKTPEGHRLYTQQEMLDVKTELYGVSDANKDLLEEGEALRAKLQAYKDVDSAAFQLAVQTEVDRQMAELTDDEMAQRIAELARQLELAELDKESLQNQVEQLSQRTRELEETAPDVILSYDPDDAKKIHQVPVNRPKERLFTIAEVLEFVAEERARVGDKLGDKLAALL